LAMMTSTRWVSRSAGRYTGKLWFRGDTNNPGHANAQETHL
jgi:hypothetical protein